MSLHAPPTQGYRRLTTGANYGTTAAESSFDFGAEQHYMEEEEEDDDRLALRCMYTCLPLKLSSY